MPISSAEMPQSEGSVALAVKDLVVGYNDVPIIHGVDILVRAGEMVAIVGPNGSGKSTLLKGIVGVARVFGGEVHLAGKAVTGRPPEYLVRRGLGYVPQVEDVFENLRVRENLEMGGYLLQPRERAERQERVLTLFPQLAIRINQFVRTMSGGERKMVAVGRALMLDPSVLLLDEPTAGLSPALTRVVLEEQARVLADNGTSVLIVEQKAKAALELADRAYVLVSGRIVKAAGASEVLADPEMAEVFLGAESATSRQGRSTRLADSADKN